MPQKRHEKSRGLIRVSVPGCVSLIQLFDPDKPEFSILCDPEPTMLRSAQYGFQNIHLKFAVRFQTTENIQNTLSAAFTLLWVSNLAGKYFQASTFLIAELVDMAGFDDFSKVSVSIHGFAVNSVQITVAGLIEFNLCRKNTVFHTGDCLIIILFFLHALSSQTAICRDHRQCSSGFVKSSKKPPLLFAFFINAARTPPAMIAFVRQHISASSSLVMVRKKSLGISKLTSPPPV